MARGTATAPARRAASGGTAERFAARVRSRRRRRAATVVAAVVVLAGLVWLTLFSPYLTLDTIRIRGTDRVPVAEVQAIVDAERGRPMVLLDPSAVAARVERIELVRTVQVRRNWPATMTVTVVERQPVAAVPATGGGYRLVDRDGVEVETSDRRPATLPYLEVTLDGRPTSAAALNAALDVLSALPADLRERVVEIGATSPDGVWLTVTRDTTGAAAGSTNARGAATDRVVWGSADQTPRKAQVLQMLTAASAGAAAYDVSAPDAPAVRPR